jgi:hypothetical protein
MEINAANARYMWFGNETHKALSDLLYFPELYTEFPQLAALPVRKAGDSGYTPMFGGEINLKEWDTHKGMGPEESPRMRIREEKDNLSDLLHEIQHAIQDIEQRYSWSGGGSHSEYHNHPVEVEARLAAENKTIILKCRHEA